MRNKNILICTVICFFMAIATVSIVNRNKNDEEFIDESKVRSIIIMNVLTGTAEEINKEADIHNICETLNTMKGNVVEDWKEFYSKVPLGNQSFILYFKYDYGIEKEFGYLVGNGIITNGRIYETTSEALVQYWNLNYPKKKWRHHNFE